MKGILFLFLFLLAMWVIVCLTGCATERSITLSYEGAGLTYSWKYSDGKAVQHLDGK